MPRSITKIILIHFLILCGIQHVTAQVTAVKPWKIPMHVSIGNFSDHVAFGTYLGATDSLDQSLDSIQPPPITIDSYFYIPFGFFNFLSVDIRSNLDSVKNWNLRITGTNGDTGSIRWEIGNFITGTIQPAVLTLNGQNMLTGNSYAFTGDQNLVIHYEAPLTKLVGNIPGQTITQGDTFAYIYLDNYIIDPAYLPDSVSWTADSSAHLAVEIDSSRTATISITDSSWTGADTITFRASTPDGLEDSDSAVFVVLPRNTPPAITGVPDSLILPNDSSFAMNIWGYVDDQQTPDSLLTFTFGVSNTALQYFYDPADGELSFSASAGFTGMVTFTFSVSDPQGMSASDSIVFIVTESSGVHPGNDPVAGQFRLFQNYPNPFNATTRIGFNLPASGEAVVEIYDVLGKRVSTLIRKQMAAGLHTIHFNADNLGSGLYFYRLRFGHFEQTKTMLLLK